MAYYIGLISGTSVDSIDAVLCQIEDSPAKAIELIASVSYPIPEATQRLIHQLSQSEYPFDAIDTLGELDQEIGKLFAYAAKAVFEKSNLKAEQISAIGSHGQTIRHRPFAKNPFTLQIGDANQISAMTGITTIADFRRKDMALGGQGAPLVPAFHQAVFTNTDADNAKPRVILNLGGIANITVLKPNDAVIGYDTGPANTLMDRWIKKHQDLDFDLDGQWAKQGDLDGDLLQSMLNDSYFAEPAPKSTGREKFNLEWLDLHLPEAYQANDVQRTLLELTAQTVADAIDNHADSGEVLVCGGGAHNAFLLERLAVLLPNFSVETTYKLGVDPDWVEAMCFAWLAHQTLNRQTGNLPSVTGASAETILGAIYPA